MNQRLPTLFSVREGTSTDNLPTQDDQVRNFQWTKRRRFELQRGFRRIRGQRYNTTLESMVSPEQQLAIPGRRRAQLAPAEVLYSYHMQTARHRVYEHYSDQRINWFNYNIENVVDHLSTKGISAIPGERRTMEELEGQSWHLRPVEYRTTKVPTGVAVHQRINRTTSLRFERYRDQTPSRASVDQRDQEVIGDEEEILTAAIALIERRAPHQNDESYACEECLHNRRHIEYDPTTPLEEVASTGWGEEFKDENQTPATKFFVREQDETESPESEWENPFATKHGESQENYCFHLNEDEELPYPKFKKEVEKILANEVAYPADEASSSNNVYNPPKDFIMGPPVYTPSTRNYQQYDGSQFQPKGQKGFKGNYGNYYNQQWRMADDPQIITCHMRTVIMIEDPYRGSTERQDIAQRDLDMLTCEDTKDLWRFMHEFRILAINSGKLYFPPTMEKYFSKLPPILSQRVQEALKRKYPGLIAGVLPAIKFTHTFVSEMYKEVALSKELRDLSFCSAVPILGYYKNNIKRYGMRKAKTYKGKPHGSHVKMFKNKYKDDRGKVRKCKCFVCEKEGHFARDCKSKNENIARSVVYQELDIPKEWDIVSADFSDKSNVYSISEGEEEFQAKVAVGREEFVFMVYEDDYEDESDEEEVAFMVRPNFNTPTVTYFPGNNEAIEELRRSAGSWRPHKELPKKSKNCTHDWKENPVTWYNVCYFNGIATTKRSRLHCPTCCLTACANHANYYLKIKMVIKKEEAEVKGTQPTGTSGDAKHKIKAETFAIEGNKFRIPLISAFDMKINDGIQMLIGTNFIRAMQGGIRIEGDEITIYKKVTKFKTTNQAEITQIAIEELEMDELEYQAITEEVTFHQEVGSEFRRKFKPVIKDLKNKGILERNP
nr:RNA-directed DNA polymerase [Tanacetum cinerariifolium]